MSDGFKIFSRQNKKFDLKSLKEDKREITEICKSDSKGEIIEGNDYSFKTLGLETFLLETLESISIFKPTNIQKECITQILLGKNIIASARTGSGKTAAFALPIIQKLSEDPFGIFGLILTPTRELAFQIGDQFKVLGSSIHIKTCVCVGGMDMMNQNIEISKRPHLIIATPGRLVDLMSSNSRISLSKLKFLVLDEADRLLEDSFADELSFILDSIPAQRQTLLFSATMTKAIESLVQKNTFLYSENCGNSIEKLDQRFVMTPSMIRDSYLVWIMKNIVKDESAIIFTGKCLSCEIVRVMLKHLDIDSTCLHSQMSQANRINSLARFKSRIVKILVITDVGSRGLDIPEVRFVINYDVPASSTDYIHRVGRTARAGRGGKAITLVTEMDVNLVLNIEEKMGRKLESENIPETHIHELLKEVAEAKRMASMHISDIKFGEKKRKNKIKVESVNKKIIKHE